MPCLSGFQLYSRWVPLKIATANLGGLWRDCLQSKFSSKVYINNEP